MEIIVSSHDNPHPKKLWDFINSSKINNHHADKWKPINYCHNCSFKSVHISENSRCQVKHYSDYPNLTRFFGKSSIKWSQSPRFWSEASERDERYQVQQTFISLLSRSLYKEIYHPMEQIVIVIQQKTLSLQHTYMCAWFISLLIWTIEIDQP